MMDKVKSFVRPPFSLNKMFNHLWKTFQTQTENLEIKLLKILKAKNQCFSMFLTKKYFFSLNPCPKMDVTVNLTNILKGGNIWYFCYIINPLVLKIKSNVIDYGSTNFFFNLYKINIIDYSNSNYIEILQVSKILRHLKVWNSSREGVFIRLV